MGNLCSNLDSTSETAENMSVKRIAIVGDVHELWSKRDEGAVRYLQPDAVLLVGDFGEENVELVQKIASFNYCKAVILGNHDAWHLGKSKSSMSGVLEQIEALGKTHVGYGTLDVPGKELTIAGVRPFSWGGQSFRGMLPALQHLYGIQSLGESAKRIVKVVKTVPPQHDVVLIGHNGPTGLGDRAHDLCGVDFKPQQGDHGDPDLEEAMEQLKKDKRHVSLMAFGHMHEELGHFHGTRRRVHVDPSSGTVYLNVAVVPRVRYIVDTKDTNHHFCVVEIKDGMVTNAKDVWVRATDNGGDNASYSIGIERELLKMVQSGATGQDGAADDSKNFTWDVLDAYKNTWNKVTVTLGSNAEA